MSVSLSSRAQPHRAPFRILGLSVGLHDTAHISFVHEANSWFAARANEAGYSYTASTDWDTLNADTLASYKVVLFLDARPERKAQRDAFESWMKAGGAWMGFHFSAFALNNSEFPDNWTWYQDTLLGCGAYLSNTWRPVSAFLRNEAPGFPATLHVPALMRSAPCEWYRWEKDIRNNDSIRILLSVDPVSFPLGTGPKPDEIWHDGYYPIAWTNRHYRMIYANMGHNDIDYEHGSDRAISSTFESPVQNRFLLDALKWLGRTARPGDY